MTLGCLIAPRKRKKLPFADFSVLFRCAKAGRLCDVQRGRPPTPFNSTPESESRRPQNQPDQPISRAVSDRQYSVSSFQPVNAAGFGRQNQIARYGASVANTFFPSTSAAPEKNQVVLPSIFTNSAYSTVVNQAESATTSASPLTPRVPKRQKLGGNGLFSRESIPSNGPLEDPISERDMIQFIDM